MENPFASSSSSSGRSRFECSCDSGVPHPPLSPFPPGSPVLHYAVRNQPNWTAGGVSAERNNRSNPLRTRADSDNWSSYPSQPAKPVNGHYASPWSPASDTYSSRSSKSSPEYPQNDNSAGRHQNPCKFILTSLLLILIVCRSKVLWRTNLLYQSRQTIGFYPVRNVQFDLIGLLSSGVTATVSVKSA